MKIIKKNAHKFNLSLNLFKFLYRFSIFFILILGFSLTSQSAQAQLTGTVSNLTDVICFGGASGSVSITGSGGASPYQYKIDDQEYQESGVFSNLTAGSYQLTVIDADEETVSVSVTINEPTAIEIVISSQTNVECTGYESGEVDITVAGGTPAYTYEWTTSDGYGLEANSEDQSGLAAGTYILILTDANGCLADLSVTITEGNDGTTPEISGGDDGSAECVGSDPGTNPDFLAWRDNFAGITATDNCGIASITFDEGEWASGGCAKENTTTFTVVDNSGNTSTITFDFRIADTTPPVLIGGADGSAEGEGSDPGANEDYISWRDNFAGITSTDICGETTMTYDEGTWTSSDESDIITVHFVAVDECELITVKQHTFTISKSGGPTITCPADISVECISDLPAPDISQVDFTGDGVTISHVGDVSDGNSCPEVITRTYRATDEDENIAECSQTIIIHDITPPVISCPGPAFIESIEDSPEVDVSLVTATDNCTPSPVISWVSDVTEVNNCSEVLTRTYMATDDCGNTTTCTQLIIINDIQAPTIICPESIMVNCKENIPDLDLSQIISVDNCGPVTVSHREDISDGNMCPEIIFRVFEAIDESGNISECAQTIIVNDTIAPILTGVPDDVFVSCNNIPEVAEVVATDNCSGEDYLSIEYFEIANSVENCSGAIVRQWIATDACGNTSTDIQTIVVSPATGIVVAGLDKKIQIYPNPTEGRINISGLTELFRIDIYSSQGTLIRSDNHIDTEFDISDLRSGTYFLKITLANGQIIRRTIVRI